MKPGEIQFATRALGAPHHRHRIPGEAVNYFEYNERRTSKRAASFDVIDVPDILVMEREPTLKDLELIADAQLLNQVQDPWLGAR